MKTKYAILCLLALGVAGCHPGSNDPRVNTPTGVKSDTATDSIITRGVGAVVDFFIKPGIQITKVDERKNAAGFLEVQVTGHNHNRKRFLFDYRVEWLDKDGMVVNMTPWANKSAMPKAEFSFLVKAIQPQVVNYRIETRRSTTTK